MQNSLHSTIGKVITHLLVITILSFASIVVLPNGIASALNLSDETSTNGKVLSEIADDPTDTNDVLEAHEMLEEKMNTASPEKSLSKISPFGAGFIFNRQNIISDYMFYNLQPMDAGSIQAFLNARVPTCTSYSDGRFPNSKVPCLKDYRQDIPTKNADAYCRAVPGGNNLPAAEIIYRVAVACGINAQVILATLQKEQSLVEDTWPRDAWLTNSGEKSGFQYRSAMGYGCPDSAPCNSEYYGFFNQVYLGARAFSLYRLSDVSYAKKAGKVYNIDTENIYMENQATASLYTYTPHFRGNENFFDIFTRWFGNPYISVYYYQNFKSNTLFSDPERTIPLAGNEISPGQEFYARVELYNAGSAAWDANTRLATSNPRDRNSIFADGWLSAQRVKSSAPVPTGAVGTFDFKMKAPSKVGVYKEYFSLVQEGYTWFNDLGQYFTVKVVNEATPERVANAKLLNGGSIPSGTVKESPKGLYYLAMQGDGNLVIYERPNNRVVWHSNSVRGAGSYTLANQGDGNIVIYKASSGAIWDSHTARFGNATLSLQDDGNLVAYTNSYAQPSWSIFTGRLRTYESLGCSVAICLGIGETLGQNASKSASNGRAKLVMQGDGNLVLYSSSGKALWNSRTSGNPGAKAVNQGDGNLVVYAQDNRPLWASNTAGKGKSALMLQGDCNLVLYNSNDAIWNTGTFG